MRLSELIISKCNARSVSTDEEEINALSESIKSDKLISKLILRKVGDKYEVIAGQRRVQALRKIYGEDHEISEEDYIIKDVDDETAFVLSLAENVNRVDLSPMDLNKAYLKLNQMGKKDKEIAKILNVTPHRLKRLETLSADAHRMPEEVRAELSKPASEAKFTDMHWDKIKSVDNEDIIKDAVDFILEHETPAKDVPSIIKAVEKQYKKDNIDPDAQGSSKNKTMDDDPVNTEPTADSPIEYAHKGELTLEKHGDVKILKVLGKGEEAEVPVEHYLEYLRHPEKFKCFVTFKLVVKPIE